MAKALCYLGNNCLVIIKKKGRRKENLTGEKRFFHSVIRKFYRFFTLSRVSFKRQCEKDSHQSRGTTVNDWLRKKSGLKFVLGEKASSEC